MSLITFTSTPRFSPMANLLSLIARVLWTPANKSNNEDESRDRRDFLLEMMELHPCSFQSELDFQNMMHVYPSRF
ncbi:hypothetical protein [Aliiruegeria lutimaris]|uniref:Uncharacterized protein n=1 Tax=Aliiruegeria lutimaris TaxID=571298 RepID=A0A1G9GT33_9RHOB|nr:hypothetical protein [Aliiruegeria lutimaris]SDL03841.1 hypothetical protein SAMN04488026_10653 [Aliiruegeria lutimaris]